MRRDPEQSPTDHVLFKVTCGSPTDKAVLVCMARAGNWWGEHSALAVDTIARHTELSRRTVQEARRRLAKNGLIELTGKSRYGTDEYLILGMQESDAEGVQESDGGRSRASSGGAADAHEVEEQQVGEEEKRANALQKMTPIERVWLHYVEVMQPRRKELDPESAEIIRKALRVASEAECIGAIDGCRGSAWHMGDNERRKKYNRLSHILKGRSASGAAPPRTTRDTIDFFLDMAPGPGRQSSATPAEISHHKRATLDGLRTPGDVHVAERGKQSAAWLKENVGIVRDVGKDAWVIADDE